MAEISSKPYLLRALHEWCTDNGYVPYVSVVVDRNTVVPREYVKNGEIVLNVSVMATNRLVISNDDISFVARFGGVARDIRVPIERVQAIYARETGRGMGFEVTDSDSEAGVQSEDAGKAPVVSLTPAVAAVPGAAEFPSASEAVEAAERPDLDQAADPPPDEPPPSRPRLVRIK